MAWPGQLRLIEDEPTDVIPFERRMTPRRSITGRVTAVQNIDDADCCSRICSLRLHDMSDAGLGARCEQPVAIGSRITVLFPPHGAERGFDVTGEVVRCTRDGDGEYQIGIRYRSRAAA